MKRLERNEARKLMGEMTGEPLRTVEFLGRTGARVSEALGVRVEDVDVTAGSVRVPTLKRKRRKFRDVPIGVEYAKRLVRGRVDRGKPLFPVTRQRVWFAMRRAAVRAGLDESRAHPHALRHGFAIQNAAAGVPVPVLRKWLGHASLSSTLVYVDEIEASRWTPETI